jgi:NAD(P)-dependent dehydrogenase (short-subunit alcohol dehydrogenase family)
MADRRCITGAVISDQKVVDFDLSSRHALVTGAASGVSDEVATDAARDQAVRRSVRDRRTQAASFITGATRTLDGATAK